MARKAKLVADLTAGKASTKQKYPALLFAGCKDVQFSYDASFGGKPNGAFTFFALQALTKKPKTPRDWMKMITTHLPSSIHPQSPQLYGATAAKDGPMP
jgi:hypothetical protein